MDKQYWLDHWEAGDIRFNQPAPHRFLIKHFQTLGLQAHEKVFVPLCGKSVDMVWLMQQNQRVVGVEISLIAISDFLKENKIEIIQLTEGPFQIYQNESCALYNGDLFDLTSAHLLDVKAVYDRGSLTALPPKTLRGQYVNWLKTTLPENSKMLLIVFEHDALNSVKPPFSTPSEEVNACFNSHFSVTQLEKEYIAEIPLHWVERGVHNLYECAYLLKKKTPSF